MFGIKNPKKILSMIQLFGIKPEQLLSQLEVLGLEKWKNLEAEAGTKVTAVVVLDDEANHFVLSLYKIREGNNLEHWRNFPLKNILENLQNMQDANAEPTHRQIAAFRNDTAAESDTRTGDNE